MNKITQFHIPGFRSTRVLYMLVELKSLYKDFPEIEVREWTDIAKFRSKKPAWYLKLNPNGKIPFMIDHKNDVQMFDSCAICTYLLEQYDTDSKLLSKKPQDRALFHQLSAWAGGTIDNLTATSSPT